MQLPSVTFVTCTYNSGRILDECLQSIQKQDYPKDLIEILVVDGGSKDTTIEIAKKYGARIITENTRRPEAATAIGYNEAKNDLIVNFPSDNVITESNWLRRMVVPFAEHKGLAFAETLWYYYDKSDTSLNRYFALFGASDPVAYYMNKRDRLSYLDKKWNLDAPATDFGDYYIGEFVEENTPTLGANGFIIRREIALKVTSEPMSFFHIDSTLDLIKMGYTKVAFVKNSIWHKTGASFKTFIKHRVRYGDIYFRDKGLRRYHLVDLRTDKWKLFKYILLSLTVIVPLGVIFDIRAKR